jgi:hypothetical protein
MIRETRKITCDGCGEEIHGDYMVLSLSYGIAINRDYHYHVPRTVAIKPCGNLVINALENLVKDVKQSMRRKKK